MADRLRGLTRDARYTGIRTAVLKVTVLYTVGLQNTVRRLPQHSM